jgi:hypothetical protein
MQELIITATETTPTVNFNPANGKLELSGRSVPEDAELFFGPLLVWLDDYSKSPAATTELIVNLEFFNISSSKRLLFMFYKFNEMIQEGRQVKVKWMYSKNDEDILEVGKDYAFMVSVPFEFISYEPTYGAAV